jgi:metal-responsive CopG/Arc/MetJ family transcriptional regulator
MSISVNIPEELVAEIDRRGTDRKAFVVEAVKRLLSEDTADFDKREIERINQNADDLNAEAMEVLEYQVFA